MPKAVLYRDSPAGASGVLAFLESADHRAYAKAYAEESAMNAERHVRLFRNGRNQAVRIPREFELPGDEAILRKDGDRLILEAVPKKSLLAVLASIQPLDEDFPEIADLPPEPVDL